MAQLVTYAQMGDGGRPRAETIAILSAIGSIIVGSTGCVAGVVLGLFVYPPTAWFAAIEVGVPGAVLGALIGAIVGVLSQPRQ
jgi:hypothetical protein